MGGGATLIMATRWQSDFAQSHPHVSERSVQCWKGHPIQSPVPGWEFLKTRAFQHPEEGVEVSHMCVLLANQIS